MGAAGILHQILQLRTTASVLVVGAHPDDEDSLFMARVARGDHARAAYFSLTRGEGGQNAIGPEISDSLGVIRSEELLQARTLDGCQQFFGREFDFGFSKTLEEASRVWGDQEVLRDIVRVIRVFRPLVVYSLFSGTPADGHGHHQLVGRMTLAAFRAAADPARFPDQIEEGLRPWQAKKLYVGMGFGPFGGGPGTTTRIEGGQVDPLLGRTYAQIAAEGRSQHRTQGMGTMEMRGGIQSYLSLRESTVKSGNAETSVFDGIDTSIPGLEEIAGLPSGALQKELADIDRAVKRAIGAFDALEPGRSVPALAEALRGIRAARAALSSLSNPGAAARDEADSLLATKEQDVTRALQSAAGIAVDFISDTETVAAGESFAASVRIFLSRPGQVKITEVGLKIPAGWVAASTKPAAPGPGTLSESADRTDVFKLTVPSGAPLTRPYWLTTLRKNQTVTWPADSSKGAPFDPPLVTTVVRADVGGVPVTFLQPLQFRFIDPVRGEVRRNVDVVPAVTVAFETPLEIVPLEMRGMPRPVTVMLQSGAQMPLAGSLALDLPRGWTASPPESRFVFQQKGERARLLFMVTPDAAAAPGKYGLRAEANVQGVVFDQSVQVVAYPHIQTHRLYEQAREQVCLLDLKVAAVKVGYIMGSGDEVPDALRRMGLDVTLLDERALLSGDLSRFDTIVVGINASAARPEFVAATPRLYEYTRKGGTLIVQYQHEDYVRRNLAPFPARMPSRVTDETAPVNILAPESPVFTSPNRIGADDFSGWVQERNLYGFATFDSRYTALLESHDPGEPAQQGGELYARLGEGTFVYTAYAWFRQLPAGVPGAYRMFANLVSLGAWKR
jgi:LmbE family N-acetylglucosaminyl deacetylase